MSGPNELPVGATAAARRGSLAAPIDLAAALSYAIRETVFRETTRRLRCHEQLAEQRQRAMDRFIEMLLARETFHTGQAIATIDEMTPDKGDVCALFESCAATLGEFWETDLNDFFEVAIASSRLQMTLRAYGRAIDIRRGQVQTYNALVSTVPGERHLFAASLLELIMRLQGWNTVVFSPADADELRRKLASGRYDVVCLSWTTVSLTQTLSGLNTLLEEIPESSRPYVLAGGAAARDREKWLVRIGVDHVVDSARDAIDVVSKAITAERGSNGAGYAGEQAAALRRWSTQ